MAHCIRCSAQMPDERLEVFLTCVGCTDQTPYIGFTEGVAKQGSMNMAKAGSEAARRLSQGGTAIIRRNSPKSVRERKAPKRGA